jgi:hypothetical protein
MTVTPPDTVRESDHCLEVLRVTDENMSKEDHAR